MSVGERRDLVLGGVDGWLAGFPSELVALEGTYARLTYYTDNGTPPNTN